MGSFLFYASVAATVIMAVLGAIVTGHDDWGKRHRWKIYAAFGALGSTIAGAQISQYRDAEVANERAEAARQRMTDALDRLGKAADAETEALSKMHEAQAKSEKLAGETLQQVIGDPEHPPYLKFSDYIIEPNVVRARAYLVNSSIRYAARIVSVTAKLQSQTYTSASQDVSPSSTEIDSRGSVVFPGDQGLDGRVVNFPNLAIGKVSSFDVIIHTAVGAYRQRTVLVRLKDNEVLQALKVYRAAGPKDSLVFKKDQNFPKAEESRLELQN